MSKIFNISEKPTYDLKNLRIIKFVEEDRIIFFQTKEIFHFNRVYGTVTVRSRVIRDQKNESDIVENVISAVIDAGYFGHLHGKIKLTKKGLEICKKIKDNDEMVKLFENCQQLHLFQSIAGNYYNGTHNNPDLVPDITFTL